MHKTTKVEVHRDKKGNFFVTFYERRAVKGYKRVGGFVCAECSLRNTYKDYKPQVFTDGEVRLMGLALDRAFNRAN
jgi:hypothetical protein